MTRLLRAAFVVLLATSLLSGCGSRTDAAKHCRDLQLKYDYHNGEATLWAARGEVDKATVEMNHVVEVVLGNPVCFPEPIVQDVQAWYTTQPGVTTVDHSLDQPSDANAASPTTDEQTAHSPGEPDTTSAATEPIEGR